MSAGNLTAQYVGPYKLDKTLGKGQTGLVKMGIHCTTGKKVAIKVINREKLSENIINKVEREIAIMKLIDHPHILGLFDVYENKKYLYLILELVSGGELFDYLVRKGRLSSREARHFFRQIVSAVDFCHHHKVCKATFIEKNLFYQVFHDFDHGWPCFDSSCDIDYALQPYSHRDLKPENLLLDEKNNIKVADFGMASLQPEGYLLETSCGSPHYACPEVIRGDRYDGRTADIWSCGVILFALLVGALPFDDDNLRHLLEKVKRGVFHIPHFVPPDAQNLLRGMIEVRPEKRFSLKAVLSHKWMVSGETNGINIDGDKILSPFSADRLPVLSGEEEADPDVLLSMSSLGCFREREKLLSNLMSSDQNTEKVVYHLLLRRKEKRPTVDDDADSLPCKHPDAPRKRVDSTSSSRSSLSSSIDDVSVGERTLSSSSLSSVGCRGSRRKLSAEALSSNDRPSSMSRRGAHSSVHQRSRSLTGEASCHMRASGSNSSNKNYTSTAVGQNLKTNSNNSQSNTAQGSGSSALLARGNSQTSSTPSSSNHWRQRLTSIKNSFLGSPRFHRRKMQVPSNEDFSNNSSHMSPSMELTKRSWFNNFVGGSSSSMSGRDYVDAALTLVMADRSLGSVKAELTHTFLSISNLTHCIVTPTRYRCEYRSQSSHSHSVFHSKVVKFQADIIMISPSYKSEGDDSQSKNNGKYHVTFRLISGANRRFKRVLELIQIQLQAFLYEPQSKPEGEITAYSREIQQLCSSAAAKLQNEGAPQKTKRK